MRELGPGARWPGPGWPAASEAWAGARWEDGDWEGWEDRKRSLVVVLENGSEVQGQDENHLDSSASALGGKQGTPPSPPMEQSRGNILSSLILGLVAAIPRLALSIRQVF